MIWSDITRDKNLKGFVSEPEDDGIFFEVVRHGAADWHLYMYVGSLENLIPCRDVGRTFNLSDFATTEACHWYCKGYATSGAARSACVTTLRLIREGLRA